MNGRVVLADKRLRLKTLCAATLVAALGLIGLSCLTSYLDSLTVLQRTDPQQAAAHYAHLLLLFALSTVLVACAAGGALSFLCWQVLRARQFPPPGIPLLWNTHVRTGAQARRLAIVGLVVAVALIVGGIGLGVVMVYLTRMVSLVPLMPQLETALVSGCPLHLLQHNSLSPICSLEGTYLEVSKL